MEREKPLLTPMLKLLEELNSVWIDVGLARKAQKREKAMAA